MPGSDVRAPADASQRGRWVHVGASAVVECIPSMHPTDGNRGYAVFRRSVIWRQGLSRAAA